MRIARITKAEIVTYPDTGQTAAFVEWVDQFGKSGCTSGDPRNAHMSALLDRARREGISVNDDLRA